MNLSSILYGATLTAALGSGLVAGVFFAFSNFVMRALARLPTTQGIAAMQSINLTVINPCFMLVLIGTALACAALISVCFFSSVVGRRDLLIAACLCYLVGTIFVTGMAHIPRNEALAVVAPESVDAAKLWTDYLTTWTNWNHVRTFFALAASLLFTLALSLSSKP